ncbi:MULTISPECIES: hypothetical protein [Chroococcidiopsis]|uniref:Uncharacterized protein n=1 Tax=Chroococcidiopsis thermalis (strain PCC 7203) TaxID=251229 RepID=K9U2Q9_CHRTP|nr:MULTISPECIES: hypothetical protein [Chroococcidiopsis]AFY88716.1 hypothetical protein Chro_3252 [Chroococcidiopsis thermalis PCC 7203]PSB44824.1 hypothetical protein C7B80_19130 [Cyanosarcina cf. burmensis CCALA 770]URD48032.1 hypothetical protein M5J74_16990 [Chroococcidiopsis sp. CCNUC1]
MNTKVWLIQPQPCLPNINLIELSKQSFGNAFLKAAQVLCQQLEQIELILGTTKDFTKKLFNLAILGLFSKMHRIYYSYILLKIHQDEIGSQFLLEHLVETAVTLTYLLEGAGEYVVSEYISASLYQAQSLLVDVKKQLQKVPNHPDLLILKDELEAFIAQQQEHDAEPEFPTDSEAYLWGPQEADTTFKRGAIVGLNFLTNPARQIALKIVPASWLDLQFNYLNSFTTSSRTKVNPDPNFTCVRDATHLCLHATQSFLEEAIEHQNINYPGIKHQQEILNLLYEWFHNAHHVYQLH